MSTPSTLEQGLLNAPAVRSECEWQVDILRAILMEKLGTKAQRASLIRLIRAHTQKRIHTTRLHNTLWGDGEIRSSYF